MLEKILKQCYDEEPVDTKSADNIKTAVLSRIEEGKPMKRKLNKKAVLISAIAFAVVGSTTAVVAGANGWNLKTGINELFDEDNRDDSAFYGYDINGIGSKTLDECIERDGYKINMVGTVADAYTAYLFYDIVVEEGYVFKSDNYSDIYDVDDDVEVSLYLLRDYDHDELVKRYFREHEDGSAIAQMNAAQGAKTTLLSQDGNVYHYATRFDFKPISIENEEIKFEFETPVVNNIWYYDYESPEVAGNSHTLKSDVITVKFDFIKYSDERYIEMNKPFEFNNETVMLEYVDLTPFSLFVKISQDQDVQFDRTLFEGFGAKSEAIRHTVKLTLKDGTTTDEEMLFENPCVGGGASSGGAFTHVSDVMHLNWARPVNVDDIESITIGDTTFTLD